jgi:hypothetical protein
VAAFESCGTGPSQGLAVVKPAASKTAVEPAAHRVWTRLEDVMNLISAAAIFFLNAS